MAAVMQKQATVATKASARLAPVAKPVALRHSFRTGALNQVQRNSRVVVARAAQVCATSSHLLAWSSQMQPNAWI